MYNFQYVTKKEAAPEKKNIIEMINEVQDIVRDKFTFQYMFVGSCKNNMITQDIKSNIGYDFDIDIEVNDDDDEYKAWELRKILINAFNSIASKHGYGYCQESTRVFTMKSIDYKNSKIHHSCDFAIINTCDDGQQYIHFYKDSNTYAWQMQGQGFEYLPGKIQWLKDNQLWNDLKDYYLDKKNNNQDPNKHSRSIFAESVNEMCQKNGYNG